MRGQKFQQKLQGSTSVHYYYYYYDVLESFHLLAYLHILIPVGSVTAQQSPGVHPCAWQGSANPEGKLCGMEWWQQPHCKDKFPAGGNGNTKQLPLSLPLLGAQSTWVSEFCHFAHSQAEAKVIKESDAISGFLKEQDN